MNKGILTGMALGIAMLFLNYSCKKSEELQLTETVTLEWQGLPAADGCGFFVKTNGKTYKPENEDKIPASYQVNKDTVVKMSYLILQREIDYFCGLQLDKQPGIRIIDIQ